MSAHLRLALLVIALVLLVPAAISAPTITPVSPLPGETVRTGTPVFEFAFADDASPIAPASVKVTLDGLDVGLEEAAVNETGLRYVVPEFLALAEGNHTLEIVVANGQGEVGNRTVQFVVNYTQVAEAKQPLDLGLVVGSAAAGLALLAAAATAFYLRARKTRGFTFQKHFLRHPGQLKFIALYVPSGIAVVLTLGALFYVSTLPNPMRYSTEIILVAGTSLAFGPFGLSSLRDSLRTRAYERAFAQFLFELADAVRGGINPVKAVQELAKTGEGVLKRHMQQAADVLRLGRPMDEALRAMTANMGSPLVSRYAALVGEASSMGGSVAGVLQRAAKDMDDLVKIQGERRRALRQPIFTMYMAFGVLLIMILQIISFAPSIGDLDLSALGAGESTAKVAKMPVPLMQERFFHLLLVNAAGAGLLVGSFTNGQVRHGILHAIVMVGVAVVAYPLFTM